MIHHTCDRCKREINPAHHTRYVVQIEIQSIDEDSICEYEDDVDHLTELHQLLEEAGSECEHDSDTPLNHRGQYDLCPDCHRQFLKNPLRRDQMVAIGFSNN